MKKYIKGLSHYPHRVTEALNIAVGVLLVTSSLIVFSRGDVPGGLNWLIFGAMYLVMDGYFRKEDAGRAPNGSPFLLPPIDIYSSMQNPDRLSPVSIPVTVLTGFLGAGKTTLLNHILSGSHGEKIAVIVNEFGEVGIDAQLIVSSSDDVVELSNGCLCCTVRGDLLSTLVGLAKDRYAGKHHFDRVVIETSGLAEPGPVALAFLYETDVALYYKLDAVITVLGAGHILEQIKNEHQAKEQIAFADILVLNKCDTVGEEELLRITHLIQRLNPRAKVLRSVRGIVPYGQLIEVGAFDLARIKDENPALLEVHHHDHNEGIGTVIIQSNSAVSQEAFVYWVYSALLPLSARLLRYKGIVIVEKSEKRIVFQGVHKFFEIQPGKEWGSDTPRTQIVLIGRDLPEQELMSSFQLAQKMQLL
jgi:G3E family GTPase